MGDLTVSSDVDLFLQASDATAMQVALEVNGPHEFPNGMLATGGVVSFDTGEPVSFAGNPLQFYGFAYFNAELEVDGQATFESDAIFEVPPTLPGYTVGTLPTGIQGQCAFVTDALLPTFLGIVAGGGAVVTKVFYNGTNWVVQ